jgi:hypothetical protein
MTPADQIAMLTELVRKYPEWGLWSHSITGNYGFCQCCWAQCSMFEFHNGNPEHKPGCLREKFEREIK